MHRLRLVAAVAATSVILLTNAPWADAENAADGKQPFVAQKTPPNSPSAYECTATGDPTANVRLDCDDPYPNDEPNVAVDPRDPNHVVVSSNDYGSCCDGYYTSFDGGRTWATGNMSTRGPNIVGSDPISVFDPLHRTVVHLSINYKLTSGIPAVNGDVVASVSGDGGLTWKVPTVVGHGRGARLFSDKEDAVVDTDPTSPYYGRIYVTWTGFVGDARRFLSSPIMASSSDDGGATWSTPTVISGRSTTYCTYQSDGPAGVCDEDQASAPRVGPGGVLHVAFLNDQHAAAWETPEDHDRQYLVVTSHDGGRTFTDPRHVVDLEDGAADYPVNVDGEATLTGLQVRGWSAGTLAVDPRNGTLYLSYSDNSLGLHDVAHPVTRSEAFVIRSGDGGQTWFAPRLVDPDSNESWFPWVDVAPDGTVGVLYNDRRPGNTYVAELAEGGAAGAFTTQQVSTSLSHPNDSAFFRAGSVDCPDCATFHGDYLGLDYGSDSVANMAWTDMRDTDPVFSGFQQFVYFARR